MADLVKMATDMIGAAVKRDFATASQNFDKLLVGVFNEFMFAEAWGQIVRKAGAFKKIEGTRSYSHMLAPVRVVFVDCKFERMPVCFEMSFTAKEMIGGLTFITPTKD